MSVGVRTLAKSCVGKRLSDVPTPAFLVDKQIVLNNCQNMLKKCAELGIKLRPHVKTHKTEEAALLQTGGQKKCITVSTFREAEFFADCGWDDILLAFPLAPFHIGRAKSLADHISTFHLLVDNVDSATALAKSPIPAGKASWSVFIKVDTGYARDLQQASLYSCSLDDVACRVMTRVIGHYQHRKQMLIDCGFTGLTKQGLNANKFVAGYALFENHPNLKLIEMSQEVGKVEGVDGNLDFDRYPIGTELFLYPYHACATASQHPVYYIHKDGLVEEEWKPIRGW
ncbi:uncharacterized protein LOC126199335 isoform X3 [Schistocerca nitens]|uniref:uncharacterized protein LOC126199335 isoform X3 n=1 Tax=Schistocerca nitens TaxID=7011 RepID=UPI0021185A62|nr:uncharacterized protein LOC126199335 isoform X3 [Schistocerca nitens]